MRIYLIRHADPDYTNDTITETGHEQALILGQYLQTLKIDEIYASPLGRTQTTARYTADLLHLPVQTMPWLRELEGIWIKDLNRSVTGIAPLHKPIEQSLSEARNNPLISQPDPCLAEENMALIRQGSDALMQKQGFYRQDDVYRVIRQNRKAIAVFTHMGVGLVWLAHLLDIPLAMVWSGFFLHPASITTILMDERAPGYAIPRCLGLGDISHLHSSGCWPKPVGVFANTV